MRGLTGCFTVGWIAATAFGLTALERQPPTRLAGERALHVVQQGESLRSIGSRRGIDPTVIAADNGLRATAGVRAGQQLLVDARHLTPAGFEDDTITVNIPQRMRFYRSSLGFVAVPVAVGSAGWRTPVGPFTVLRKEENPTWDVPLSIAEEARRKGRPLRARVPPGPRNPLGEFWLGLSIGAVGIHGTNSPKASIRR